MNHTLYSADRQTHRRIVGSAFVAILIVTMLGDAVTRTNYRAACDSAR
jgi:hypothetical protein